MCVVILIGQFDSPFVRRVGIALSFYGIRFEHRPWAVFRDAEKIGALNPLRRVPTLVLDDGSVHVETFACLELLDEAHADAMGEDDGRLLLPRRGTKRRDGLRLCALAAGVADKAVSLVYERLIREHSSPVWSERCALQVRETLAALDTEFATRSTPFFLGERIQHPDIAATCAMTFMLDAHGGFLAEFEFPHLLSLRDRCEAREEFRTALQPFDAPLE
jgi:glutathione S-transferase